MITDLPGATLGRPEGSTMRIDANAAGWGWFVDPTPWKASEFHLTGDQGEQHRMDLLSALTHELGHLLGRGQEEDGFMSDILQTGERPMSGSHSTERNALDAVLQDFSWWNDDEEEGEDSNEI